MTLRPPRRMEGAGTSAVPGRRHRSGSSEECALTEFSGVRTRLVAHLRRHCHRRSSIGSFAGTLVSEDVPSPLLTENRWVSLYASRFPS